MELCHKELHASGEDYLEAVLMVQCKNGMARSVDVARQMGVSEPGVSHIWFASLLKLSCLYVLVLR